jgi:transposase
LRLSKNLPDWKEQRQAMACSRNSIVTEMRLWRKITTHGIKVGRSAVARFLLHLQLTFKKNHCSPLAQVLGPSI